MKLFFRFNQPKTLGRKSFPIWNHYFWGGCINHHIDIWRCPINKNRGPHPPDPPGSHVPAAPSAEPFEGHDFDGADRSGGERVYPAVYSCEIMSVSEKWRENKIQEWPETSFGWGMLTLSRRCSAIIVECCWYYSPFGISKYQNLRGTILRVNKSILKCCTIQWLFPRR